MSSASLTGKEDNYILLLSAKIDINAEVSFLPQL